VTRKTAYQGEATSIQSADREGADHSAVERFDPGGNLMKVFIWLSFDLGVKGDFEGMYQFLDTHGAKECCDSVAAFTYEYKNDLIAELTKTLREYITFNKRSRVYLIFPKEGKYAGRFIIGSRKAPPWTGFANSKEDKEEEDIGE
jgi:hypothetical protein